jgi:uncharacterized membrane protein
MGYRQTSYDPASYERYGPPLRPFNWVQWAGVGMMALGLAVGLAFIAGYFGLIPFRLKSPAPITGFVVIGSLLINTRRQVLADPAPELAAERKRLLIITTALCVVVLGAATVITLVS